jgi:sugar phosphate isomerase/epimerase
MSVLEQDDQSIRSEGIKPIWNASLSTMWAKKNSSDLIDFFTAAHRMGFAHVELNHSIDSSMLHGIDLHKIPIRSIHEPCPADISTDMLKSQDWLISSDDETRRRKGVQSILRSIDLAHQLQVPDVVVHAGNVQADIGLERTLRTLFNEGQRNSQEYRAILAQFHLDRKERAGARMEATCRSMIELLEYALPLGIRLGLENRYHYLDIPTPDEMDRLLALSGPDQLGFVYDVGHAEVLARLDFFPHAEWLERFSNRMIGVHFHDVIGVTDHHTPGTGEVDFSQVAPHLSNGSFRTFEIRGNHSPAQVQDSLEHLSRHHCITRQK